MNILALDTSGDALSVALLRHDEVIEDFQLAPRQHNALILPMLERLLSDAALTLKQLDAIAFGRGPGSFTGLRIAASIVQGMAFSADLPVIPISTLQALAQGALRECAAERVIAAIDARIDEIYWAAYSADDAGLMQAQTAEIVCAPTELALQTPEQWQGAGSGWDAYHTILEQRLGSSLQSWLSKRAVHAQDIVRLAASAFRAGDVVDASQALPVYLRDQVVKEKPHG